MTVGELIEVLKNNHPDELEVILPSHSDYDHLREVEEVQAVEQFGYVMRTHRTMSEDNKSRQNTYVVLR